MEVLIVLIPPVIISTFIFIHINYKKYPVFTALNDMMMFKKMLFNKKMENCAGKKTTLSFFFLTFCTIFLFNDIVALYFLAISANERSATSFSLKLLVIIMPFVQILVTRLIYEFVIIPIAISNNGTTNQQQITYVQQQNYVVPNQVNVDNQSQQAVQNPVTPDNQFKFCSQCGTRYNASDGKCPNCGMQ